MFLTLSAGGAFSVKMAERASGSKDPELPALDGDSAPWLPDRIKDVLTRASDFAAYKRARVFRFLHLFAGKNDVLGKAVKEEAARAGVQTEIRAVDWSGAKAEAQAQRACVRRRQELWLLLHQRLSPHEPELGLLEERLEPRSGHLYPFHRDEADFDSCVLPVGRPGRFGARSAVRLD